MLNLATVTARYKAALEAGGADPLSPLTLAMAQGFANALIDTLTTDVEVLPTGVPPFSNGSGPVVGKGILT